MNKKKPKGRKQMFSAFFIIMKLFKVKWDFREEQVDFSNKARFLFHSHNYKNKKQLKSNEVRMFLVVSRFIFNQLQ